MTVIRQAPNVIGAPRVDPVANDFDIFVYQKGVDVIWESAVVCPCKSDGRGFMTTCLNCGGVGSFYINPVKTRMVLQSMNLNSKFKEWTQEKIGMTNIIARTADYVADMDRITVVDSLSKMSQVVYPKLVGSVISAFTIYPIKSVIDVFMFVSDKVRHRKLSTDEYSFTVNTNRIQIKNTLYSPDEDVTITVRYKHPVQYYVVDVPREIRQSTVAGATGVDEISKFPISAIGRRCHYIVRPDSFNGTELLNNSYE